MGDALINRNECVLILIDFQEKLLPVMWEKERVLDNAVKLAKFAEIINLPVILTEQDKLGSTADELAACAGDSPAVGKISFDCFGEKSFRDALSGTGRKTLILAGIEAHICVAQTAMSALQDYNVHVVCDAVSSRSPHNCDIALKRLARAGAVVTSTEMVIYELLKKAGTDEFKATLKLVK